MNYLLIGRPNVGKTSIFNILTKSKSIVHKSKGTTRDWHKKNIYNFENTFIFDTPGIILRTKKNDNKKSLEILNKIINDIDIILLVIDYKSKFNQIDNEILKWLRKFGKLIYLIINKFDNYQIEADIDYLNYNIKNNFFFSCTHKYGFKNFINFIEENSLKNSKISNLDNLHNKESIGIFGKPNAGKSTFFNTLIGFERSLTSPNSGTTSDSIIFNYKYKNKIINIIDTAGIGRKSNLSNDSVISYSIKKSFENIKNVTVAIILIDSAMGLDRQDKRIIKLASEKSKNLIIVFNKIDKIKKTSVFKKNTLIDIKHYLHEVKNIKIFFCNSFSKKQINYIFNYINKNILIKNININTSRLNLWLNNVSKLKKHPIINNKSIKFKYAVIANKMPITLKIFCNYPKKIRNDYKNYLKNNFNQSFKILNQNTRIVFLSSENPYDK